MTRPADILLAEITDAIDLIQRYTSEVTFAVFCSDIEKQDAVFRRLEIIGQAVKTYRVRSVTGIPVFHGVKLQALVIFLFTSIFASISNSRGKWFITIYLHLPLRSTEFALLKSNILVRDNSLMVTNVNRP